MISAGFNFVIDCADTALEAYKNADAEDASIFNRGDLNWCLRCYLILSKRGRLQVSCSNRLVKGAINLIHSDQLLHSKSSPDEFVVCVQADFPKRNWAQYHIVQNINQLASNTSYVPHWIQPGLIKRDANRNSVRRVGYAGQIWNGNFAGSEAEWKRLFEPYDIEFVTLPSNAWHDLRSIDVLIGIRSFDKKPHTTKPPSKLFSAWLAGIPFVGGYDSAYRQVGVPGENYLLAVTPQETVAAVVKLQKDAEHYASLVRNGQQQVLKFTHDHIAEIWEQVLTGPVAARYQQWQSRPQYEQQRFLALHALAMLKHQPKQLLKKWLRKADGLRWYKPSNVFK